MKIKIKDFIFWRKAFLIGSCLTVMLAIFLPVDFFLRHAISPEIIQQIKERGTPERLDFLREQFKVSLAWLRIASALLGLWGILLVVFWNKIHRWSLAATLILRRNLPQTVSSKREFYYPFAWFIIVIIISFPLLYKGFEHTEVVNLEMLAKRGPLVSLACQNHAPMMAQPGFTVWESIFVKMFGTSEVAARMPALIFGALIMFPFFFIARRFGPVSFANITCLLLAITGFYLFYITYARGYALSLSAYIYCLYAALLTREQPKWKTYVLMGIFAVISCHAHLSSSLYVVGLAVIILFENILFAYRQKLGIKKTIRAIVQPVVVFVSAIFILFLLYSATIPSALFYAKNTNLTNFYTAYHVNFRFLNVIVKSWSPLRDLPVFAYLQAIFFLVGSIWAFYRYRWLSLYLILPGIGLISAIAFRGLVIYPRYLLQSLPSYVIISAFLLWQLLTVVLRLANKKALLICILLLSVAGSLSLKRLYSMERCGVRAAVSDAKRLMRQSDRIMATLESYITAKYYYPLVTSGYSNSKFWEEIDSINPPEYIITVPFHNYLELDIPSGPQAIERNYALVKKYPSWLDVDDDQDSVYLYRLKAKK